MGDMEEKIGIVVLCNIPCTKDVWLLRVNILTKIYIQKKKKLGLNAYDVCYTLL